MKARLLPAMELMRADLLEMNPWPGPMSAMAEMPAMAVMSVMAEMPAMAVMFMAAIGVLTEIAKNRGCLKKGGEPDTEKAALLLLDDFRSGRLGRMSLESPEEMAK